MVDDWLLASIGGGDTTLSMRTLSARAGAGSGAEDELRDAVSARMRTDKMRSARREDEFVVKSLKAL